MIDINANGTCDSGEAYEDANGNGIWDANRGRIGSGGARDAVLVQGHRNLSAPVSDRQADRPDRTPRA